MGEYRAEDCKAERLPEQMLVDVLELESGLFPVGCCCLFSIMATYSIFSCPLPPKPAGFGE